MHSWNFANVCWTRKKVIYLDVCPIFFICKYYQEKNALHLYNGNLATRKIMTNMPPNQQLRWNFCFLSTCEVFKEVEASGNQCLDLEFRPIYSPNRVKRVDTLTDAQLNKTTKSSLCWTYLSFSIVLVRNDMLIHTINRYIYIYCKLAEFWSCRVVFSFIFETFRSNKCINVLCFPRISTLRYPWLDGLFVTGSEESTIHSFDVWMLLSLIRLTDNQSKQLRTNKFQTIGSLINSPLISIRN